MDPVLTELAIAATLFAGLGLAVEAGFRIGRRTAAHLDDDEAPQLGAIQGAILGLLGLLLAFSFSGAAGRFIDRMDMVVAEANAIGTAYLRTDLLGEPERTRLRSALQRYTETRLSYTRGTHLRKQLTEEETATIAALQNEIWASAMAGVTARPQTILAILNPVNEVIDLHTSRLAVGSRRLPPIILAVLIVSSLLAVGIMGYSCGLGGKRRLPLTMAVAVMIAAILWITIDLDQPRAGMLQVSDAPLEALEFDPD
jgi:hypothetical protein